VADGDDGITIIPIGPGLGTSTEAAKQFSSGTARFLRRFASNPAALVISVVSGFVVSVILGFFEFLVGAVLYPFDLIVGGLSYLELGITFNFALLGTNLLELGVGAQRTMIEIVESAGPAGPVLAAAIGAVLIVAIYRTILALLVAVPGGDSLLTMIGVR
jgi:hypothetical protein